MYVFGSGWCRWRGGEWMRELGFGFTNPVGTGGVLDMCLCFGYGGVGVVGGEWVGGLDQVLDLLCRCIVRLLEDSMMVLHLLGSPFLPSDGFYF